MEPKASDKTEREGAADLTDGFDRLAAGMLEAARSMPMHPLMMHPAAAFAAAAAIGFGLSTQMAGAFFGALQGAMEAPGKKVDAPVEQEAKRPEVAIKPENLKPAGEPSVKKASKPKLTVVRTADMPAADLAAEASVQVPAPVVAKAKAAPRRKADDLKLIAGIGPKLEQVLNEKGIGSFADIAGWTDDDVARVEAELGFGGRIKRDDWIGQAKVLAARGRRKK